MPVLPVLLLLPLVTARLHSLPEDPFAFPKYKVDFLSHLPVHSDTAKRWLAHGIRGGVREFLDQPRDDPWHPPALGDGDEHEQIPFAVANEDLSLPPPPDSNDEYSLEHMKMGSDEYLCLIPKPVAPPQPNEEAEEELTPAHSWALLHPLTGTCLYHRQPWFTYSYCHNAEIRQFREVIKARSLTAGAHQPEEDTSWEAFTLGRAPTTPEPGADLTVAQQDALAANLELARNAGSRYLVQRWGDGTICDKTGKPREVEVQFHCSMTTTDTIVFVKEVKTCSYVLVVHTPRLCGEPGFMSNKDAAEQASISCREIVAGEPAEHSDAAFLPDADHPLKHPLRKPVLPLPQVAKDGSATTADGLKGKYSEVIRKALDVIKGMQWQAGEVELEMLGEDGEGNLVIQFVDEVPNDALDYGMDYDMVDDEAANRIAEALREAGIDITLGGKLELAKTPKTGDEKQDENDADDRRREVEELAT